MSEAFQSHHPLQHKRAVIRTLLERSESIVTEEEDRKQEEEHIRTALHTCGYPDWAIKKVKEQMNRKKAIGKDKSKKDKAQEKSTGVVTVRYVHSFAEKIQCIFTKHKAATVVKPQTTLKQVLVHPKDKNLRSKKRLEWCTKFHAANVNRDISVKQGDSWEPGSQNTERKQKRSLTEISQNPPAELLPMNTINQP